MVLIFVLLLSSIKTAVAQSQNSLLIARDHLILQIDLKSPRKAIDSILKVAGITGRSAEKFFDNDYKGLEEDGWNLATKDENLIRFDRSLADLNDNPQSAAFEITTRLPEYAGAPGYPEEVKYGVNKFSQVTVFGLSSGFTRFILPGNTRAKRVILSGNFNNWSTLKGAMKKTDGGWILDVKLAAGAYEYKYIINGRWTTDPDNLLQVDDGVGNTNSLFFKYNYTIKLPGHSSAHNVVLAGDFNKWKTNEIVLEKKGNGWEKQLYLSDGKHIYHFLVDGRWVTDPGNPVKLKDGEGNLNSVLNLGSEVTFKLAGFANAKKVFLAGTFNKWRHEELALVKNIDGWALTTTLVAGNYNYKFIVDGDWITDPANPHFSTEGGISNSYIAVKPNHTFKLKGYVGAKKVKLVGSFNNWNDDGYTMARAGDEWIINFYLKPGKYMHKFAVDGKLIIDPGNKLWEQNEYGTGNSVLWIE